MVNKRYQLQDHNFISPYNGPWTNAKHAKAQVNGQTQQTQHLIILERETRKRS